MTIEDYIKSIIEAIESIDRVKFNRVVVCHPSLKNYFLFHSEVLRCKVVVDNLAPTDKAYLFDRDEYEKLNPEADYL